MCLLRTLKDQDDKGYGQECEVIMCIMSRPKTPQEDPAVKAQREESIAKEQTQRKELKQEALSQRVSGIRGGSGRRSLISSSGGGMGYYNEYKS